MQVSTRSGLRIARAGLAVVVCLTLEACGGGSIDRTATASGARDTGTFPNLNVPPTPAAEQITDSEKTDTTRALMQARQRATSGTASPPKNQSAELRRLAGSHGKTTLEAIEAEQ